MEYTDTSTQSLFSCSVVSDSLQPQWSLPGSTAHGISQARILEQVAFSFSMNTVYQVSVNKRKIGHGGKSTIKTEEIQWVCKQHRSQIKERAAQKGTWHTVGTRSVDGRGKNELNDEDEDVRKMWLDDFYDLPEDWGSSCRPRAEFQTSPLVSKLLKIPRWWQQDMRLCVAAQLFTPQLALPLSRHPKLLPGTPVLSGHWGSEFKHAPPSVLPQVPNTHKGFVPNVLLYVWPLNLSLCLLAPE